MTSRTYSDPDKVPGFNEMEVSLEAASVRVAIEADASPALFRLDAGQCADLGAFLTAAAVVMLR